MKRTTVTLLPFAPYQQQQCSTWSPQRSTPHSRLPNLLGASVPCILSAPSPSQIIDISRRRNALRISPSIISEASCDSSSSSSSSSSSFPSAVPTSCSTQPPSLPPSPPPPMPPSHRSPGKSRPLPQPPASNEWSSLPSNDAAATAGQLRPRTPPPAWSPPGTTARPTRPSVMLPPAPARPQSAAPSAALSVPNSPSTAFGGPGSSPVQQHRVRRLPTRPVPPGPPSEANTPVAPFGLPRWHADTLTGPQDDTLSPYDDRRAIDWDLIDEVMKNAG